MKYAGHIKRQHFLKIILEAKIEGMRGVGPQRFKWEDNTKGGGGGDSLQPTFIVETAPD